MARLLKPTAVVLFFGLICGISFTFGDQSTNASSLTNGNPFSNVCHTLNTCDECISSNSSCHFCAKDNKCHAKGSPYGCVIGTTCHHLDDCTRKKPEYVGFGIPPLTELLAVISLGLTMLLTIAACFLLCTYCRRTRPTRIVYEEVEMENKADDAASPSIYDDGRETLLSKQQKPRQQRFVAQTPTRKASPRQWCLLISSLVLTAGVVTFGVLFAPQIPGYSVCNRELDVESVIQSLKHFDLQFDYSVLLSVKNPNRLSFVLEEANVSFAHNGTSVGNWYTNKTWSAQAGTISDVVVVAHFNLPSVKEAYHMYTDFNHKTLFLDINSSIKGHISLAGYPLYYLSYTVPNIRIWVGADAPRDLCKCPYAE